MGVQKRKDGRYEAFIYVPVKQRKPGEGPKRYLGRRKLKRDADLLFEDHKRLMRGKPAIESMTVNEYAGRWLEFKHGPDTRRPSPNTLRHNRQMLKAFLETFGDRALDSIPRDEALDWCRGRRTAAKSVSAMFNDAVNDDRLKVNPFANRQQKQGKGRKDIEPMTEQEIDLLGNLALEIWGDAYGPTCRAWILFSAWVGTRPGETFGLTWPALDFKQGLVTVTRVKPPYNTDVIVFPRRAQEAILAMGGPEDRSMERVQTVFRTVTDRRISKGANRWYFDPVRKAFETHISTQRRDVLREGKQEIVLYSLRHFCASIIVANGGNEFDVAAQLGHSPEIAREIYIHDFKDRTRDRIRGLLDGGDIRSLNAARRRKMGGSN